MFGIVCDSDGKEFDYVGCKKCNNVLSYKKGKSGTSNMQKHKCILQPNQPLLTKSAVKMLPSKTPTVGKKVRETVTAACVDFCAEDLRPFDSVAGKGFLDLMQVVSLTITFLMLPVPFISSDQK